MDKFILICYSTDKSYLDFLLSESHKCFGDTAVYNGFEEKQDLFKYLEDTSQTDKIQLIILNIAKSNNKTVPFLSNVNQRVPNAVKLLVSKSNYLLDIQQQINELHSIHFLNRSCSSDDFLLALKQAKKDYSTLQIINEHQSEVTKYSRNMDQKVAKQLQTLMDSNVTKEKLLSIIAHDLKSPFTALLGISEILINDWNELSEDEKLDLVQALKLSSENTFKLLENLLNWIRTQKSAITTENNTFNIAQLIDSTTDLLNLNSTKKQIFIENNIDRNIELIADKNMVEAVFRNLISNAIKYIPTESTINISSETKNGYYTFCVADNGEGVQQQFIIDFFSKKTNHNKSNLDKFRGMGLLMCKDFMERNNGEIWLESQKEKGSKFYLQFPNNHV